MYRYPMMPDSKNETLLRTVKNIQKNEAESACKLYISAISHEIELTKKNLKTCQV